MFNKIAFLYVVFVLCIAILPARISTYYIYGWCLWRQEEGVASPKSGVMIVVVVIWCWKLNQGPLDGQLVVITIELFLYPLDYRILIDQ